MARLSTKKTKGRQKIEIKKIENDEDRLITFSKRRSGIYKKASELAILTDATVAFVVYSPGGKAFSFGHPSVEAVVNRFLGREERANNIANPLLEAHLFIRIDELSTQYNELLDKLDVEKEKEKGLKRKMWEFETEWWDTPIEELNVQEIQERMDACKSIEMALITNVREMNGGDVGAASNVGQPQIQPSPSLMFNTFAIDHNETLQFPSNYGQ